MTADDYIERILPLLNNPLAEEAERREVLQSFYEHAHWSGAQKVVAKTFERGLAHGIPRHD